MARILENLDEPLAKVVAEKRLGEIKGIGEALERKITALVETGKLAYYDELKASIPPGLIEMLKIPGLGPKKIQILNQKLGVDSVEKLEAACQSGKVAELDGFGVKTQTNLLEGIERRRTYASKHLLSAALSLAEPLLDGLREHPQVLRCSAAGSLRRFKEIIGDIDLLASSKKPLEVIEHFVGQPRILKITCPRRDQGERDSGGGHPMRFARGERQGVSLSPWRISPAAKNTTSSCVSARSNAACGSKRDTACSSQRPKRGTRGCWCPARMRRRFLPNWICHIFHPNCARRSGGIRVG